MRRREFLGAVGTTALAGVAGCTGLFETRRAGEPPVVENRPDAVYYPTHVEGMEMVGTDDDAGYRCALTYSYPHRFWRVTSSHPNRVDVQGKDSVHAMVVVWHRETGIVPMDVSPQATVTRDGDEVASLSPWAMLSQRMGVHFGDNVALDGGGVYRVEVDVGGASARRTGALADAATSASFAFDFDFRSETLDGLMFRDIPSDREGTRGAVDPMTMEMLPDTQAPASDAFPGTVRGSTTSGDVEFVVATLDDAERFGGDAGNAYLAVSPRTRYNRYVLPLTSLSATLRRGSETVFDGELQSTIDPDLDHHYGASVPGVESGDEVTIRVDAPPQISRHEGYETAFFDVPDATVTL